MTPEDLNEWQPPTGTLSIGENGRPLYKRDGYEVRWEQPPDWWPEIMGGYYRVFDPDGKVIEDNSSLACELAGDGIYLMRRAANPSGKPTCGPFTGTIPIEPKAPK